MPIGYDSPGAGQAMAYDNLMAERDLQERILLAQRKAAVARRVPGVPEYYYQVERDTAARLAAADTAVEQAERQHNARVVREKPLSVDQARRWYDDALAGPLNEQTEARQAHENAVQALGKKIEAYETLNALLAREAADRAAVAAAYQEGIRTIERNIYLARVRCEAD